MRSLIDPLFIISLLHSIFIGLIGLRIILFKKSINTHRPVIAFVAYLLVITTAASAACNILGLYKEACWLTFPFVIEFFLVVCFSQGNIAKVYRNKSPSCPQYKPCQFSYKHKKAKGEGNFASINRMLQKSS